jgi:ABC-2 type transport system ATP-binding protein
MHALPAESALSIRGLSFAYGATKALDDIRFELKAGTFTALLGHNGAGKSTLFMLALRLLAPPPGTILIAGHDLARAPTEALRQIGVVFQEPTLDLDLSVRQNLAYFGALRGMSRAMIRTRIADGLASANLDDLIDRRVRTLSMGQRRRIEIVRAMLHEPRILLLDEPTTGLDIPARAAIVERVHALARDRGVTVLWATHIIDEVGLSDQVVVLHKGKVLADGPVADLVERAGTADLANAFAVLTSLSGRAAAA